MTRRKIKISFVTTLFALLVLICASVRPMDLHLSSSFLGNEDKNETVWKRITGEGEEFSVMMPGETSLYTDLITSYSGKRRLERIYSSYSRGVVYLVVSYDNIGSSIKDTVANFKAHHLYNGELTFERETVVDKYKGEQDRLKMGGATGTVQFVVTKKHAYAVAIVEANDDPPLTEYFMSSLSLLPGAGNSNHESGTPPQKQPSDLPQGDQSTNTGVVFSPKDVGRKAVVISRPEPWYTEEGRQSGVTGTVVLRVVLSSSGEVTYLRAVSGLPRGLTENAMEAARHIKFIPAIKDGHFVSQYIQIEYNFGLY